ncbi:MAG: aspartate aminotransferase family protein [Anaerolineae bacterium]
MAIPTQDRLPLERSTELEARARRVIPCITQTASRRPQAFAPGRFPSYIARGQGAHVWDVDGNEYIDCFMACGPVLLGYCNPEVDRAIVEQLQHGIIFSRATALEVEVAELLTGMIPCAEAVRFLKGGAEANAAALRMARAYTGRELVLSCGYRGWHDQFAAHRGLPGIPKALAALVIEFPFNDLDALRDALAAHPGEVAAVTLDPVARDAPQPGFLEGVCELAHAHGAVLIYDEIVTGFRTARGGAQAHYGVTPDLGVFAKGIANGMPLAAVVGERDIVRAGDAVTLTYGDEALSLAAAKAALTVQLREDVSGHIWQVGQVLMDGLRDVVAETGVPFRVGAIAPMISFVETGAFRGQTLPAEEQGRAWVYLLAEMARRGVICRRNAGFLLSYAHTSEDIDHVVGAFAEVCAGLAGHLGAGSLAAVADAGETPTFRRL